MKPAADLLSAIRRQLSGKFARDLAGTVLWQVLAKLVQIAGVGYAAKCLGTASIGVSGTVIGVAATLQLFLTFGLDAVAVRRVATDAGRLEETASAVFTLRAISSGLAGIVWISVVLLLPMGNDERLVWLMGAFYLILGCLDFIWIFQAIERMPAYSFIQMLSSIAASIYYLAFFKPGQRMGSDLLVVIVANAIVWLGMFWHLKWKMGVRWFRPGRLSLGKALFSEAKPNWIFNLLYSTLTSANVPLIYVMLGQTSSGLYRSAQMLVTPLQLFLSSFTFVIYPRIVVWRDQRPGLFLRRVFFLAGLLLGGGIVAAGVLVWLHRAIYLLIFGPEFSDASVLVPWLVFSKFCAAASGVIVLALFACRRDRLAVACGVLPVILLFAMNLMLLPKHGIIAGAWATVAAELLLLASCVAAWRLMTGRRPRSHEKSAD